MKATIFTLMLAILGNVMAAPEFMLSRVAFQGTNRAPGLIDESLLVDYATPSAETFMASRARSNQEDVIWNRSSLPDLNAMIEESVYVPYIAMSLDELSGYVAFNTNDVYALTVLGVRLYQTNEIALSLWRFESALQIDPFDDRSAELYSAILIKAGDLPRAMVAIRSLVDHLPQNNTLRFNMACACALLGEKDEAMYQLGMLNRLEWGELPFHMNDGDLEALRGDAKFQALETSLQQSLRDRIIEGLNNTPIGPI